MSEFTGAVYQPPGDEFPLLAVLFKDGKVVSWREVTSVEEGDALIAKAVATLPTLE
jgi:hypothetical protein